MKRTPIIAIILFIIGCIFSSKASAPANIGKLLLTDDSFDSIYITDRQDLIKPYIDEIVEHITYNLTLPLVSIKDEKLKANLSNIIKRYPDMQYLYLVQGKLRGKHRIKKEFLVWELSSDNPQPTYIEKYSIGYSLVDSVYIIIDESAKSSIKKIKGYDKNFNITVAIYETPFNYDPFSIYY